MNQTKYKNKKQRTHTLKSLFSKPRLDHEINSKNSGSFAEQLACDYLIKQKLILICKNYYCRQGEFDLIMQDKDDLVFVEVRYRKNEHFGSAIETIGFRKIQRIKTAIAHYQMTNKLNSMPCRIDVIGLTGSLSNPKLNWKKNIILD